MSARPGPVRLHLLRHPDLGDPDAWDRPDEVRSLSPKGRRPAERLGAFLASADFAPDAIVTSPLLRARETAEIAADGEALRRPLRDRRAAGRPAAS